ncbi:hypothetical protein AAG570_005778 [Ranatra chinensis]|uniref:Uncharacterized protein n=1 Tax=Ranatra chinensis TaxID=642074 RepID=A0ABD0YB77_9HEMI
MRIEEAVATTAVRVGVQLNGDGCVTRITDVGRGDSVTSPSSCRPSQIPSSIRPQTRAPSLVGRPERERRPEEGSRRVRRRIIRTTGRPKNKGHRSGRNIRDSPYVCRRTGGDYGRLRKKPRGEDAPPLRSPPTSTIGVTALNILSGDRWPYGADFKPDSHGRAAALRGSPDTTALKCL